MLSVSSAIRNTSGKLKQSNIARSQYATLLLVGIYACVYAKREQNVKYQFKLQPIYIFTNFYSTKI